MEKHIKVCHGVMYKLFFLFVQECVSCTYQVWSILKLVFTLRYKPMYQNVNVLYKYNTSIFCQEYDNESVFRTQICFRTLKRHNIFIKLFKLFYSTMITDYIYDTNPTLITRLFWLLKWLNTRKTREYQNTKTIILRNKLVIAWAIKQTWNS